MGASEREWMPDGVAAAYVGGLVGIPVLAALLSYVSGVHIALVGAVLYLPWLLLVAPRAVSAPGVGDRSVRVLGGLVLVPVLAAVIDFATPVPFGSALLPLFVGWAVTIVPRNQPERQIDRPAPRKGMRPVRVRWLAGWAVVAVVTVPVLLVLLFL